MIKLIVVGILLGALSVVGCDNAPQQPTEQETSKEEFVIDTGVNKGAGSNSIEDAQEIIKMTMTTMPLSPYAMLDGLLNQGYSEEVAVEAVASLNINWNETALRYGKYWLEMGIDTPEKLEYLMNEGWFDTSNIDYTIDNLFK